MENLVLIKHSVNSPEEAHSFVKIIQDLQGKFNVYLMLMERDANCLINSIPIFEPKQIFEFYGYGVALDIDAAKLLEKAPVKKAWFLPIQQQLGYSILEKIESTQDILDYMDKENE